MKWKPNNLINRLIRMKNRDKEVYEFIGSLLFFLGILLGLDVVFMILIAIN